MSSGTSEATCVGFSGAICYDSTFPKPLPRNAFQTIDSIHRRMKVSAAQKQLFLGTGATRVRQEKETSTTLQELGVCEVFEWITMSAT